MELDKLFTKYADYLSDVLGTPRAFFIAAGLILLWLSIGPYFHFSDTWQLVINSVTNTAEFLMLFLIQNTQNRNGAAIQIKVDELIRASHNAHNALLDIESLTEEQLNMIREEYIKLARLARNELNENDFASKEQQN